MVMKKLYFILAANSIIRPDLSLLYSRVQALIIIIRTVVEPPSKVDTVSVSRLGECRCPFPSLTRTPSIWRERGVTYINSRVYGRSFGYYLYLLPEECACGNI